MPDDIERWRREDSEVVNANPDDVEIVDTGRAGREVVTTSRSGQVYTRARHSETYSGDPYAERRALTLKLQQGVYLLFGIVEGLIAIRFVLRLLAANPRSDFAMFIYTITSPFLAPFVGLFGAPRLVDGSVLEVIDLVAIIFYALVAWVLAKAVWLLVGETRSAVHTQVHDVDSHHHLD